MATIKQVINEAVERGKRLKLDFPISHTFVSVCGSFSANANSDAAARPHPADTGRPYRRRGAQCRQQGVRLYSLDISGGGFCLEVKVLQKSIVQNSFELAYLQG